MGVTATFDFNAAEHYRVTRAVTRLTPVRYYVWGFVALAVVMLVWNVAPHWADASLGALFWSGLPWIAIGLFWIGWFPFVQRRAASKLARQDPSVRGPQERLVDAEGYHSRGNGVGLDVPWHAMLKVVETREQFLFFYNKQCAYYLPKRALGVPEVAEVRTLAATALGDRARLLAG